MVTGLIWNRGPATSVGTTKSSGRKATCGPFHARGVAGLTVVVPGRSACRERHRTAAGQHMPYCRGGGLTYDQIYARTDRGRGPPPVRGARLCRDVRRRDRGRGRVVPRRRGPLPALPVQGGSAR